jgi:Ca2+-binding EF-hand superfamily protein
MYHPVRTLGLASLLLCSLAVPCRAADLAPKPGPSWADPVHYYRQLRQRAAGLRKPEFFEMAGAIVTGSDMGPGDGWFHDSQSRYGWKWLAARYDTDHNGTITRQEFTGPSELFERLDRNHDGVLTAGDFDWSDRSLYALQGMPARFWFSMLDKDSNGRITKEEWAAAFERASKGKGYLTPDDLRETFPTVPPPRRADAPPTKPAANEPSPMLLLERLLTGELGSCFEGPALGQRAPEFMLKTQDGSRTIGLAQFRGKKPVVLVFGSFT